MLIIQTRNRLFFSLLFFFCLLVTRNSFSVDSIQLFIEQVTLEQLLAQSEHIDSKDLSDLKKKNQLLKQLKLDQLTLTLDLTSTPVNLKIDLSKLVLPQPYTKITSLDVACHNVVFAKNKFSCDKGQLSFKGLFKGIDAKQTTTADFLIYYDIADDVLDLSIEHINLGAGELSFKFNLNKDKWQTTFNAKNLDYQFFNSYVLFYLNQENKTGIVDKLENAGAIISLFGQASGILSADAQSAGRLEAIKLKGNIKDGHYEYGDNLAEKLAFDFNFNLQQKRNKTLQMSPSENYQISLFIDARQGEILQNDIYIVLNGNERIRTHFNYQANKAIDFSRFDIASKGFFSFKSQGEALLNNDISLHQLNAHIDIKNLSQFNQAYLNNILSGTDYEELQIEGGVAVKAEKNKNTINVITQFNDFSMAFEEALSVQDLDGKIHWNNIDRNHNLTSGPVSESQLSWQELTLNHLPLGASQLTFIFHNGSLELTQETDIPIFDGALHINSLEVSQIFSQTDVSGQGSDTINQGFTLTVDGTIKPVSMSLLSSYFDWPLLNGTLSAVIPSTTYNEKHLTIGGALMLNLFDGVIIIKDLQIDEPLKDYAQLFANIDLNNINLKSLTKTYNFGEIEGRVEGKLSGLELSAWEPVAFDAYIRTPKNDKSRHRISQRAIDNLSSLGGASGLLSRSFLSFFETFRYDRIGLSCKLKNNICHMSGIEAKGNSYYIVKGGGIPRIDVMGFQRQVNWQVLTSRLKAIQLANEAVIE